MTDRFQTDMMELNAKMESGEISDVIQAVLAVVGSLAASVEEAITLLEARIPE